MAKENIDKIMEELDGESPNSAENKVSKEVVSLQGFALTEEGKLTRSRYFDFLRKDLDDYSDIEQAMTPAEARRISNHLRKLSTGSTAMIPMFCGGPSCPFADRCPLEQMKKAPIGRQCLIEVELMKVWTIQFISEYDIDPNNFTEIGYINELAEIEVLLMRLNQNLAKVENAELIIEQPVGISESGAPILAKVLSPFMEQKEKLYNRRSKVIKCMVGDREGKYKKEAALKIKLDSDASTQYAEMRSKLDKLKYELANFEEADIVDDGTPPPKSISPQDIIDED